MGVERWQDVCFCIPLPCSGCYAFFFFVVFLSLFIESIYLERPFGQCYNQAIKFPFLYFALVTVNYDDPQ